MKFVSSYFFQFYIKLYLKYTFVKIFAHLNRLNHPPQRNIFIGHSFHMLLNVSEKYCWGAYIFLKPSCAYKIPPGSLGINIDLPNKLINVPD